MAVRICCVSDLHGTLPKIERCDLLIVAGDVCPLSNHLPWFQAEWLQAEFAQWLAAVPAREILWTAGNHDFVLEQNPASVKKMPPGYVIDAQVEKFGLKIWLSPWS